MINFALGFRKILLAIFFLLVAMAVPRKALASGDIDCSPIWRPVHYGYDRCSNMAMLAPGNDTRVNLLLLMADLRPATLRPGIQAKAHDSPLFSWGELAGLYSRWDTYVPGTPTADPVPCPSVLPKDDAFAAAVRAEASLRPEEREALLVARIHVQKDCPAAGMAEAVATAEKTATSTAGHAYAGYLAGAAQFWQTEDEAAAVTFSSLLKAPVAWVREAALYMVGRAILHRVQESAFNEYGWFKQNWHADPRTVASAETALDRYLLQYPRGTYALSVHGLKRRLYWLAGDQRRLTGAYTALLLQAPEQRGISDAELLQEIDNKVTTPPQDFYPEPGKVSASKSLTKVQSPLFLAISDLLEMRTAERMKGESDLGAALYAPISMAALQQQKQYFAADMTLYNYLLAVHALYIDKRPAEVLRLIPEVPRQGSWTYLQFSRQMLRGLALEALKDPTTLAFWTSMLQSAKAPFQGPALELAFAWHHEHAGTVAAVFSPGSPVHYSYYRDVLLERIADAKLLRAVATNRNAPQWERDTALFTLLYKEATRGQAEQFLRDLTLVPSDAPTERYHVATAVDPAAAANSSPPVDHIPLGIFLHNKTEAEFACPLLRVTEAQLAKDATNQTAQLCVAQFVSRNWQPEFRLKSTYPDEVGDTPSLFPGAEFAQMDIYVSVIGSPKASRNDRAYALFNAINCYATTGLNLCDGKDVPVAQRKTWFRMLKRDYADTRWASAQKYYW